MRKVIINLQECLNGMKMAETIYNDYGAVIVSENSLLDEHIIRKLNNLGIMKIKVFEQDQNILTAGSSEIFKAQYNENIEVVKDVIHDIYLGKNLDMNKVNTVSDSIYVRIKENRDIVTCINQIKDVDEYTYTHCMNVSLVSMLIGKWMKLSVYEIRNLVQAGLLHDIGKSKIPQEILNKPGVLTYEELDEVKKHPIYGLRIVENIPGISKEVCMGVLMHHEREDGSGYPLGAKGEKLNIYAKVIAVADIYDAMTSNRVYRGKETPFEVFELMENNAFGYLDPIITRTFLQNIAAYYIGDIVRLNSGKSGEIIYINPRHISQPIIKVGNEFIDLSINSNIKISEIL